MRFSWWGGDERHQATLKAISAYQTKNPQVKIEGEYGGWDGYYEKLVTQLAGGTAADILQIDQPWLFELSGKGEMFLTLDGNQALDLNGFDRNFLNSMCAFNGQIKGVPTGLNGESFLVDTDRLKASGIDPNTDWSWDNFLTEGAKVNAADPDSYLLALAPDMVRFFFIAYMAQSTGGMIDADKTVTFSEEQAAAALTYFKRLLDEKILPPFSSTSLYKFKSEENPDWVNGKLALMHSWASNQERSGAGRPNLIVKSLPIMPNAIDSGILVRPSQILTVNNNSKNKDEAVKFVNWFFNDPEAIAILGSSRGVPPTVNAREILTSQGAIKPMVQEATDISLATMGRPQTAWEMNSEITQIMDDEIEQLAFGKKTPQKAAQDMRSRIVTKLGQL